MLKNRYLNTKLLNLKQLEDKVNLLKKNKKKIVLCHGCFDILHWGHAIHFNNARKLGDKLFVTLTKDKFIKKGPNRPIFNHKERAYLVSQLSCVDFVSINNQSTALDVINIIKPNVYVKGIEYKKIKLKKNKNFLQEKKLVKFFGGKVIFTKGKRSSSTLAVKKLYDSKKI